MSHLPRLSGKCRAITDDYATQADSVPVFRNFLPSPERIALGFGIGRAVIGAAFLAAPVLSVRVLGVDSATAKRMTFLARMAAARDIGLGAGALAAGPTPAAMPWLVAGAAADAVDAIAITAAMRQGTARGLPAAGIAIGAAVAVPLGIWAALGLRRSG